MQRVCLLIHCNKKSCCLIINSAAAAAAQKPVECITTMPYRVRKVPGRSCFRVTNKKTGRVLSKCTTRKNAQRQIRLLHGLESGRLQRRRFSL
jgi:hypothetical protein